MPRYNVALDELASVLSYTGRLAMRNGKRAMYETAKYGKKAVQHTIKATRDPFRIKDRGDYQNPDNWEIQERQDGYILSPTAFHSLFVERGRRPGHRPPFWEILEWGFRKKIGLRRGRGLANRHFGTPRTHAIVKAIQWKIAKKGTKGRWPLKRTMPKIAKRAQRELNKSVRASIGKRPIKRKRKVK